MPFFIVESDNSTSPPYCRITEAQEYLRTHGGTIFQFVSEKQLSGYLSRKPKRNMSSSPQKTKISTSSPSIGNNSQRQTTVSVTKTDRSYSVSGDLSANYPTLKEVICRIGNHCTIYLDADSFSEACATPELINMMNINECTISQSTASEYSVPMINHYGR